MKLRRVQHAFSSQVSLPMDIRKCGRHHPMGWTACFLRGILSLPERREREDLLGEERRYPMCRPRAGAALADHPPHQPPGARGATSVVRRTAFIKIGDRPLG
ncbi:hypothetical protein VTJ04DRAFT_195 [Mycothermus thermophilus]|uniref:uncharacterized protein n=1 Tax=Humicola insolens TaxID=85995 RepID=UPI00374239AF